MENLIEELTKVNPSCLSEEGLKLFNKINEIIDRNKELEEKEIWSTATIEDLKNKFIPKSLIKEKIEELNDMIIETHRGNLQRYTVSEILSFQRFCEELL